MSMREAHKAVSLGAEFLDRYRPGWEHCVNLNTLDLRNGNNCIIGQVEGREYCDSVPVFGHGLNFDNAKHYGFNARHPDFTNQELTSKWSALIKVRRLTTVGARTDTVSDVMIEGKVTVGSKEIMLPPVTLDYLLKLIEANR